MGRSTVQEAAKDVKLITLINIYNRIYLTDKYKHNQ